MPPRRRCRRVWQTRKLAGTHGPVSADTYQVGAELLIPANRAAGTNAGVIAQFHMLLDDLLPGSVLGRPLFDSEGVPMHSFPIAALPVPA